MKKILILLLLTSCATIENKYIQLFPNSEYAKEVKDKAFWRECEEEYNSSKILTDERNDLRLQSYFFARKQGYSFKIIEEIAERKLNGMESWQTGGGQYSDKYWLEQLERLPEEKRREQEEVEKEKEKKQLRKNKNAEYKKKYGIGICENLYLNEYYFTTGSAIDDNCLVLVGSNYLFVLQQTGNEILVQDYYSTGNKYGIGKIFAISGDIKDRQVISGGALRNGLFKRNGTMTYSTANGNNTVYRLKRIE